MAQTNQTKTTRLAGTVTYELDFNTIQNAEHCAIAEAQRHNISVAVAIVDGSGILSSFFRMPGSFLASVDYAKWKAWTAASFKMPSQEFGQLVSGLDTLSGKGLLAHPQVTALPGGFPIKKNETIIGAIGVSGGHGDQDDAIAKAALSAFEI